MVPPEYRFMWIVPDQVGACAYPSTDDDWAVLHAAGIGLIINLHPRAHGTSVQFEQLHLPVQDLVPPTQAQLREGVQAIRAALERGQRVAVHCAAGMGRTGTLLACYFVEMGASADDAIAQVRARRPGSIESPEQEQAVHRYAASRQT